MSTKSKGLTIIKDICERFSLKLNIKSDSNGTIITIENNRVTIYINHLFVKTRYTFLKIVLN